MTLIKARRLNDLLRSKIVNYVVNRQNKDGGYTFCQGAESNAQDTYYGLSILNLLKTIFPNAQETIKFINDIHLGIIYSTYYVTKASLLLGADFEAKLKKA